MRTRPITILVILLMIGWPITIVGSVGAGPTENPALSGSTVEDNFIEEGDDQFTNVSDDLIVWERSFKPLRADTTVAETRISNTNLIFKDNRSGVPDETSANRPETAIFEKDETIPIEFRSVAGASTNEFNNRSAQIIVASFDENEDTEDVASADQLNEVISPALDGDLSELRTEAADRNVEFTVHDTELDKNGELDYDLDPDTAGPYVVMVALPRPEDGEGFATDGDDLLTLPGNATLMGVEGVMVQDSASDIDPPNRIEPGEEINLDPSTELSGSDITHSVVVYDEATFRDQTTKIRLDEDISSSLTTEDVAVEHSIASVNGVGEMSGSGTIFGTSVSQRTVTGTVPLADIVDQLSSETDVSVNRETISPETELDASGVVKPNAGATTDLTVQTYGNWSEGTYRIVHVAENGTVEGVATSTDTITIEERTRDGGRNIDDDDDDDETDEPETDEPETDEPVDVEPPEPPAGVNVSVNETANIEFDPETNGSSASFSENNTVESVSFRFEVRGSVNARTLDREPDETGPAPGASAAVTQISVGDELENSSATIRMRISKERLEEIGADAEDLRINRFADGEWQGLETEVIGETDTHVRVEAETPGFSYFAASAVSEPEAVASVSSETVEPGEEVELSGAESTDRYGEIESYDWNVAGETLTGETVTAAVDETGTVEAELTVTNDAGETDTATVSFDVQESTGDGTDDGADDGTGDGTDDGPTEEPGGFPTVVVILVVFVLAAVAAVALYARREE